MFILVANKLYNLCVHYSLHTSVVLEDDGLTADCGMSNKNTFSKYFIGFSRKKNTGTLNRFLFNTGYSLKRENFPDNKLKCSSSLAKVYIL